MAFLTASTVNLGVFDVLSRASATSGCYEIDIPLDAADIVPYLAGGIEAR